MHLRFFAWTSANILAFSLWYYNSYTIYQLPSLVIKPATPTILIILAILKQLAKTEASALTPSKPRKRKLSTFKFRFICPNGSSTFCLRSAYIFWDSSSSYWASSFCFSSALNGRVIALPLWYLVHLQKWQHRLQVEPPLYTFTLLSVLVKLYFRIWPWGQM